MQWGANSCFQQPFGAVSILPCLLEPLDSCWEYILPYVQVQVVYCHSFDLDHGGGSAHSAELKLLGFGQTFQTRADSENFSALVFFQIWDTISSPCFYKVSASNHTVCNPMGTALKGICKGQHSQYMTLLNGQVCVASSNSFLQKLTAGLFLTLKPNCILLNLFSFFCGPVSEVGDSPLHSLKKKKEKKIVWLGTLKKTPETSLFPILL